MAKVLVLYYSMYGHIEILAEAVAEGVESVAGASVDIMRVPELMERGFAEKWVQSWTSRPPLPNQ